MNPDFMKIFSFFLIFFLQFSIVAQTPEILTKKALKKMNLMEWEDAEILFQRAIDLDPNYPKSYYNKACLLAIRLKENFCEYKDRLPEIYELLHSSIKLEKSYKEKILQDPDLDVLQSYYRFYEILQFNPRKTKDLSFILTRVKWYTPSQGIFGPESGIDFQSSGKVAYWYLDPERLPYGEAKRKYIFGKYFLRGNRIVLRFEKNIPGGRRDYYGELKNNKLFFPGFEKEFSDDADPCSA
jgi:tetratricopeptide (TPR) repeat protein